MRTTNIMTAKDVQEFEEWWSKHGVTRPGGDDGYEKGFAYHAWERQADRYNFIAERRAAIEQRLFVWAHEKLDEDRKTEYFNIVANGMESAHDNNNYMRLLNQEKHRALIAERERDALLGLLESINDKAMNLGGLTFGLDSNDLKSIRKLIAKTSKAKIGS